MRPTADRVREAIFSILGERTEGASVLDLFAGTGALGLEALSRGGAAAVLVESDARTFAVLRRNVRELGADEAEALRMDYRAALRLLRGRGSRFRLAFLDPPYGKGIAEQAAAELAGSEIMETEGMVVIEEAVRAGEPRFPSGWIREEDRRYGDTRIILLVVREEPT